MPTAKADGGGGSEDSRPMGKEQFRSPKVKDYEKKQKEKEQKRLEEERRFNVLSLHLSHRGTVDKGPSTTFNSNEVKFDDKSGHVTHVSVFDKDGGDDHPYLVINYEYLLGGAESSFIAFDVTEAAMGDFQTLFQRDDDSYSLKFDSFTGTFIARDKDRNITAMVPFYQLDDGVKRFLFKSSHYNKLTPMNKVRERVELPTCYYDAELLPGIKVNTFVVPMTTTKLRCASRGVPVLKLQKLMPLFKLLPRQVKCHVHNTIYDSVPDTNQKFFKEKKTNRWGTPMSIKEVYSKENGWWEACPHDWDGKVDHATIPWKTKTFINPPYSMMTKFVAHAASEVRRRGITVHMLIPYNPYAEWWIDYCDQFKSIELLKGVKFVDFSGKTKHTGDWVTCNTVIVHLGPQVDVNLPEYLTNGTYFRRLSAEEKDNESISDNEHEEEDEDEEEDGNGFGFPVEVVEDEENEGEYKYYRVQPDGSKQLFDPLEKWTEATFKDMLEMKRVNYDMYKWLKFVWKNDLNKGIHVGQAVFAESTGQPQSEFFPGGSLVKVTECNKRKYIRFKLYYEHPMWPDLPQFSDMWPSMNDDGVSRDPDEADAELIEKLELTWSDKYVPADERPRRSDIDTASGSDDGADDFMSNPQLNGSPEDEHGGEMEEFAAGFGSATMVKLEEGLSSDGESSAVPFQADGSEAHSLYGETCESDDEQDQVCYDLIDFLAKQHGEKAKGERVKAAFIQANRKFFNELKNIYPQIRGMPEKKVKKKKGKQRVKAPKPTSKDIVDKIVTYLLDKGRKIYASEDPHAIFQDTDRHAVDFSTEVGFDSLRTEDDYFNLARNCQKVIDVNKSRNRHMMLLIGRLFMTYRNQHPGNERIFSASSGISLSHLSHYARYSVVVGIFPLLLWYPNYQEVTTHIFTIYKRVKNLPPDHMNLCTQSKPPEVFANGQQVGELPSCGMTIGAGGLNLLGKTVNWGAAASAEHGMMSAELQQAYVEAGR